MQASSLIGGEVKGFQTHLSMQLLKRLKGKMIIQHTFPLFHLLFFFPQQISLTSSKVMHQFQVGEEHHPLPSGPQALLLAESEATGAAWGQEHAWEVTASSPSTGQGTHGPCGARRSLCFCQHE